MLNLRPSHKELRDPKVRTALLGAIDRNRLVSTVLGGDATRADALVPTASWAFDATSAGTARLRPRRVRRRRCATRAGPASRAACGSPPPPATRTGSRSSRCPPRPTRASRRSLATCATRGSRRASTSASRWSRRPTSRRRCAAGDYTAAVVDIAAGPRAGPLPAARLVPGPGERDQPVGLPGPVAGPAPGGRPQARDGGGSDRRVEGAAGRAGDPDAAAAARLERRRHARAGPRRGLAEAHLGPRGPLLGCASMAPRRGPVMPSGAPGPVVEPRWRNGRRAGFRYQ